VRTRRMLVLLTAAVLATTLSACGDEYDPDTKAENPTAAPSEPAVIDTECSDEAATPSDSQDFGTPPAIDIPDGPPPCELVVEDLEEGSGKPVTDLAKMYEWNYEGVSWSTGEVFDSSFERGEPAPFPLNQVISGWTEGLQGIKPGGRRVLVIPADQAYGPEGRPGIAGNETLVFVVDLIGPAKGA
jgi:peptidylprolyl isomerase